MVLVRSFGAGSSRRALVSGLLLGSSFPVFGGAVVASTAFGIKRTLSGDWITSAGTMNPQPALQHESVLSTIGKTPLIRLNRQPMSDFRCFALHRG